MNPMQKAAVAGLKAAGDLIRLNLEATPPAHRAAWARLFTDGHEARVIYGGIPNAGWVALQLFDGEGNLVRELWRWQVPQ